MAQGSIWGNRVFRRMFAAYSLSTFGDWFDIIAIATLLGLIWKVDPVWIGLTPIMYALPGILFGQAAGVIADRVPRRTLMITADLLSCGLTVGLYVAETPYLIFPLLLLRSLAGVFNVPAQQSLTRRVVAEEQLLQAASWNGLVNQIAKIGGPLIGGALLVWLSPQACLLVNAVSFLISALILISTGRIEGDTASASEEAVKRSFREEWREGWQVVLGNRVLLSTTIFGFFGMIAVVLIDFQTTVLLRDLYPGNTQLFGWCIATSGVGSVISITLLKRQKELRSYGWLFGGGYLLIGIGFAGNGLLEPGAAVGWLLAFSWLVGLGNGMWIVTGTYLFQKEPPKETIGRVNGIQNSISSVVLVTVPLIGGWQVQEWGASSAFFVNGCAVAVVGLIGVLFQAKIWSRNNAQKSHHLPQ
ncbi:MFS transporter [Tumebacillus sp. DT12]|uniref:MFS transporter n=1 Tax=Tumebacillus lacus TaxID=2995335 RepID=A0ABT3X427_9BACL|nr:MFS transporter [Tumebacillus lacus]MCX7570728.1 MFS transporter [Tumebacillus lacus]